MNVFIIVIIAMAIILLLLRKKFPLGPAMLIGGLIIWGLKAPQPSVLMQSVQAMLYKARTYDLIAALYLVMCLEIELRTSGTLAGLVAVLQRLFSSSKVTLAAMPAFLGLLPSLGGARFSAPIVEEASKNSDLDQDQKAAINFWFRHPFEFSNPIIPGMIMACSIAQVPYAAFAKYTCWMSLVCIIVGWVVLIHPIKMSASKPKLKADGTEEGSCLDIFLSLSPVILTFLLVVFLNLNASIAMGIVTVSLFLILLLMKRPVSLKEVIFGAMDHKMLINVVCILTFIEILTYTNVLKEIVVAFQNAPLPVPVIIAMVSFCIGVLTGMSQAHVSIIMPIVAALQTGSLNLAAVAMIFGVAGQMLTPTHMCLVVTLDYFNSNIFKTLKPILFIEAIILTIFSVVMYIIW